MQSYTTDNILSVLVLATILSLEMVKGSSSITNTELLLLQQQSDISPSVHSQLDILRLRHHWNFLYLYDTLFVSYRQ